MTCNCRRSDPLTSALAAAFMHATGIAKRHRDRCLAVVRHQPGLTAREIEARIGIKAHKRLPELRRDGLVVNGPARVCSTSGRLAMTWLPKAHLN